MHSPEENIVNRPRKSVDQEETYAGYEQKIKILHRVEMAVLILTILQTTMFYKFWFYLDFLGMYDFFFSILDRIQFNFGSIVILIWAIQISHIVIIYFILKRLNNVLKTEAHSFNNIRPLFLAQLILINLIPSVFNLLITIVLVATAFSVYRKHKAT